MAGPLRRGEYVSTCHSTPISSQPPARKKAADSKPRSPPQRLVKEAYDTLKDKQLRERLQIFDLPTEGSRIKLQARHERWVVIYNANLDQAPEQQNSTRALRAQLIAWEAGRERDEREKARAMDGFTSAEDYEVRYT